jgi:hypothetical protein
MRYVLDSTAEKMVHALCEAVALRKRLGLAPDRPEAGVLGDLLDDLVQAVGLYGGVLPESSPGRPGLDRLVWDIHLCQESWHVARAFLKFEELRKFAFHPYFSMADMKALDEWQAQKAASQAGPPPPENR